MQRWLLAFIFPLILTPLASVHAQSGNAICVVVFDDANGNTIQDPGENPLAGVTVTVALETNLIIQSHITTTEARPHCFNNLADGNYVLTFQESPNHRPLMQNQTAIALANGQPVQVKFAAIPEAVFDNDSAANVEVGGDSISGSARLALGIFAAVMTTILMLGLGLVITAVFYR